MDQRSFKQLWIELIQAKILGTYQKRELVFRDEIRPNLKIYMYKEPNHNRPHVHIYFGSESLSLCIRTQETLAGSINVKLLKPIKQWIAQYENNLMQTWYDVQLGKKPELLWAKDAQSIN